MLFKREQAYRCVLSSRGVDWVAHIRAWDAKEAAQLFRLELEAEGLDEQGSIDVRPLSAQSARA